MAGSRKLFKSGITIHECFCLLYLSAWPLHWVRSVVGCPPVSCYGKARWFLEAMTDRKGSQRPQVGLAGTLTFLSVHTSYSVWGQRVWSPVAIREIRAGVKDAASLLNSGWIKCHACTRCCSLMLLFSVGLFYNIGYSYNAVHFYAPTKHVFKKLDKILHCF